MFETLLFKIQKLVLAAFVLNVANAVIETFNKIEHSIMRLLDASLFTVMP